ncbi:hypothetical protein [Providencia stuartii]|uniref:hypothetical protein n=1 Tax=Providencia stuartii TaxID=588 RepID=UPI003D7F2613
MKQLSIGEILSLVPAFITALGAVVGNIYIVVKWLLKFSANKRAKLLNYYNEYNELPKEEPGEITKNFIIRKIKNAIDFEITKIRDEFLGKIFMFVILNAKRKIDSFLLKRVIRFVSIDNERASVDFVKLKRENIKSVCISLFSFILMFVFVYLLFLIDSYPDKKSIFIEIYLGSLAIMSEAFGLMFLNKYNRIKPVGKLNNALAEIDASAFKTN